MGGLAVTTGGRLAAGADNDGKIYLFATDSDEILRSWDGEGRYFDVHFTTNDKFLIGGDFAGQIALWDYDTGLELARHHSNDRSMHKLAMLPDGKTFLSGSGTQTNKDYALRLWRLPELAWPAEQQKEQSKESRKND